MSLWRLLKHIVQTSKICILEAVWYIVVNNFVKVFIISGKLINFIINLIEVLIP